MKTKKKKPKKTHLEHVLEDFTPARLIDLVIQARGRQDKNKREDEIIDAYLVCAIILLEAING